tara:strand:- start:407 stop:628 length:222 start_codon:yes stop_codon:yes gene_type:complete
MPQDVRFLVDKHYSVDRMKEMELFDDGNRLEESYPKKRAYMRGLNNAQHHTFSVAVITCALGEQLLQDRAKEE